MKVNLIKQNLPLETENQQMKSESHHFIAIPFVHSRAMYIAILLIHILVIWFALQIEPAHPEGVTYALLALHFITIVMGIWISIQPYEHRRQVLSLLFHAYYGLLTSVDLLFISGKLIHTFFNVTAWWMYALLGVIYVGAGLEISTAGKWRPILSSQQRDCLDRKIVTAEQVKKRENGLQMHHSLFYVHWLYYLFYLTQQQDRLAWYFFYLLQHYYFYYLYVSCPSIRRLANIRLGLFTKYRENSDGNQ
ncbi:hypothetical protein ACLMAB_13720 [Brevibacillus laterosporus]